MRKHSLLIALSLLLPTAPLAAGEDMLPQETAEALAEKWVAVTNGYDAEENNVVVVISGGEAEFTLTGVNSALADGRLVVFDYLEPENPETRQAAVEVSHIIAVIERKRDS